MFTATIFPDTENEGNRDIYEELTKILAGLLNLDLNVSVSPDDWGLTFSTEDEEIYNEALSCASEGWYYEEL